MADARPVPSSRFYWKVDFSDLVSLQMVPESCLAKPLG